MCKAGASTAGAALAVVLTCLCVFVMGGVVFGISSFYPVLYGQGLYEGECDDLEACPAERPCCAKQRSSVVFLSSACLFAADGIMVLYGELNDRAGAAACLASGSALAVASFLGLWLAAWWDLGASAWFAALLGLGLAGPGVFMGCLGFGGAYPAVEPVVSAIAAAMWDSSAVVFLIWAFAAKFLPLAHVAFAWALGAAVLGFAAWRLLKSAAAAGDGDRGAPLLADDAPKAPPPRLRDVFARRDWAWLLAFMALYNLKSSVYIETVSLEVRALGAFSEAQARRFDVFFDVAFPAGGLATSVVAAACLQRWSTRPKAYFAVVVALAVAFVAVQLAPARPAQYAAAALFGPARTFQWAAYFHFVESQPDRFPPALVGRLLGYGNLVVAIVGDGLPYACAAYAGGAPWPPAAAGRYVALHGALAAAVVAAAAGLCRELRRPEGLAELHVFDMDGTLLVSRGREIIVDEATGARAAVHPLIEAHVTKPPRHSSSYAFCGEEDAHGDPFDLIENAVVVPGAAAAMRAAAARPGCGVAVLTARAHDAAWLADKLSQKLGLPRGALSPARVLCVYHAAFGASGSTSARKNAALLRLVAQTRPRRVVFYDDVAANVDGARRLFDARGDLPPLETVLVPLAESLAALEAAGEDVVDALHPQCRDSTGSLNPLVMDLQDQLAKEPLLRRLSSGSIHADASPGPPNGRKSPP